MQRREARLARRHDMESADEIVLTTGKKLVWLAFPSLRH